MHKKELLEEKSLRSGKTESRKAHTDPTFGLSNQTLLSSMGSGKAMPEEVRAKMEESLGADFSGVRLFESPIISDNGAEAVASGNNIAFAPGRLDMSSRSGLGLLGHELSHVASQARGEVSGSGFVNDAALEHQADLDGDRAASAFDSVSGMTLTPMTAAPAVASSAGPMQAKKGDKKPEPAEIAAVQQNTAAKAVPAAVPAPAPTPAPKPKPAPPKTLFKRFDNIKFNFDRENMADSLLKHGMFLSNGGELSKEDKQTYNNTLDKMYNYEWGSDASMDKLMRTIVAEKLRYETILSNSYDEKSNTVEDTLAVDAYQSSMDLLRNFVGYADLEGNDETKKAKAQKKMDAYNAIEQELWDENAKLNDLEYLKNGRFERYTHDGRYGAKLGKYKRLVGNGEDRIETRHVSDKTTKNFFKNWTPQAEKSEFAMPGNKIKWSLPERAKNLAKESYEYDLEREREKAEIRKEKEAAAKVQKQMEQMNQMKLLAEGLSNDQLSEVIEYLQNYQSSQNG